ncbi:HalOD1 output domain-containing protein [Halomarina litorea]|uniref:HalOD1 output domain-containing protein n=1 Tax=Halomarina litorea TaxID=2961595 RepID=UPI0020C369A5|nr:HalOD1 output domain-containing protein [Halomarina sp. BCD28]
MDGSENVSDAAVEALAAVSDETSPSLHDIVDPDALDSLFAPRFGGTKREGGSWCSTTRNTASSSTAPPA